VFCLNKWKKKKKVKSSVETMYIRFQRPGYNFQIEIDPSSGHYTKPIAKPMEENLSYVLTDDLSFLTY